MPQIVQLGAVNLAALNVPDIIVQVVPPQLLINGIPTNIVGAVGTAAWGQKNSPVIVGGYQDFTTKFGLPQPRKYDLGSFIYAATQQGAAAFRCVRVSDGTDTAATVTIQTNCLTLSSIYTGSLGNTQQAIIGPGSLPNSYKVVLTLGGMVPEVFDSITQGVVSFSVTAGAYTVCPTALTFSAPQQAGGILPAAAPILVVVNETLAAGGSGYAANDIITLSNGVQIKVLTVTSGAVTTFSLQNAGQVVAGNPVPSNPVAQTSTTGSGTGATFNLTWGLGQPVLSQGGQGYTTAPTVTIVGGTGSGGSITAVISAWQNIANAINLGQSGLRGPSVRQVATVGSGTALPTTATYTLAGGSDGASPGNIGVTGAPALVGQDAIPRTGMYAMRAALISIGALVDCDDSTTWTTQTSFGASEGIYMVGTGPIGDTISNATTVLATSGVNNFTFKLMFGDWCYINDPVTGVQRLISPQGFVCGVMGNQAPNQSPLNKQMFGIIGTQKSSAGLQYTSADLQALSAAGIDVICNPNVGGNYFGCRLGINTSSNLSVNGDNYTRMTYFLARTLAQGMGPYVGQLNTYQENQQAITTVSAFFQNLQNLGMIGTPQTTAPVAFPLTGPIGSTFQGNQNAYQVVLNQTNNPQTLVGLGYQFIYVKVIYLAVIRYLVIDLEGGQTVMITNQLPTATMAGLQGAAPSG